MLRVFPVDLYKHRGEDLFTVIPDPSWISMRTAHASVGRADLSTMDYVGWIVPGDELIVESDPPEIPGVGPIARWKVRGFESETRMNLGPLLLAGEGVNRFLEQRDLTEQEAADVQRLVAGAGLRVTAGKFFSNSAITIVRRDALGKVRWKSSAHLPVSWSTK
jgi:CRISPR-associated endonuclease Csn1